MFDCGFFLIIVVKNGYLKFVLIVLLVMLSIIKGFN